MVWQRARAKRTAELTIPIFLPSFFSRLGTGLPISQTWKIPCAHRFGSVRFGAVGAVRCGAVALLKYFEACLLRVLCSHEPSPHT